MTRNPMTLAAFLIALLVTTSPTAFGKSADLHAIFKAPDGDVIEIDTRNGILRGPGSRNSKLYNCSNDFQICVTDHHGFAFSFIRKCNDNLYGNDNKLTFRPRVIWSLENDSWMVFDASPNYLFHDKFSQGIVEIYLGSSTSFDFRSIFHTKAQLDSLRVTKYRLIGAEAFAACEK